MADRPWWMSALQWGLWAFVMFAVMGWLARARKSAEEVGGTRVLRHPPTTLIAGLVCTLLFVVATIVTAVLAKPGEWWTAPFFFGFALMSSSMIGEAVRVRHELRDEGIAYRGLFTRYDRVSWGEIASAHWSPTMKWLALTTGDGRVLRFSAMLSGLDSLALALNERASRATMDDATAQILSDARQGKLPSIWV